MKIYWAILILFLQTQILSSQNQLKTETYISVDSKVYPITASEMDSTGMIAVKIRDATDANKTESYSFTKHNILEFREKFKNTFKNLNSQHFPSDDSTKIDKLYYKIMLRNFSIDESVEPETGDLIVSDTVRLYLAKDKKFFQWGKVNTSDEEVGHFLVEDVSIEFYEGYIETIAVDGTFSKKLDTCKIKKKLKSKFEDCNEKYDRIEKRYGEKERSVKELNDKRNKKCRDDSIPVPKFDEEYRFENKYGIGFSTRNDFGQLLNVKLHESVQGSFPFYINLGELLTYKYKIKEQTRDFSPANQVLYTKGGETETLKKEQTSKLLEAIVYSDFLGFDQNNANGLIQFEITKRVNMRTRRFETGQLFKWWWHSHGFVQYIKPYLTISKIEDNNKYLIPTNDDSILQNGPELTLATRNIASPIEIINKENFSIGLDLNILFFDNPDLKTHFYFDVGASYGRTAVRDSVRTINSIGLIEKTGAINEFGINYNLFSSKFKLKFLPEERFSIIISYSPQYFYTAFDEIDLQTRSKNEDIENTASNWISSWELMGYLKVGKNDGRLFARWQFNNQWDNVKENFHQLQVGYSFYVLQKK